MTGAQDAGEDSTTGAQDAGEASTTGAQDAGEGSTADRDRWIRVEGAANVRDLGGLPAAGGVARVKPGMLFRGDSPHRLTAESLKKFGGLRTFVDLRGEDEVKSLPPTPLPAGAEVVHFPWRPPNVATSVMGGIAEMSYIPIRDLYEQFVEANRDYLARTVELLADPKRLPAYIHCFAGKDRAGITVAVILELLGTPDEAIVADYTMTDEVSDQFNKLIDDELDRMGVSVEERAKINPDIVRAPADQMAAFLDIMRARWGSAEKLVTDAGVGAERIDALRRNLTGPS